MHNEVQCKCSLLCVFRTTVQHREQDSNLGTILMREGRAYCANIAHALQGRDCVCVHGLHSAKVLTSNRGP